MSDATVIRSGVRSLLSRQCSAMDAFVAYVVERTGCSIEQASGVLNYYRKHRLVAIDSVNGTWHVKHGTFLDVETLRRALELTTPNECAAEVRS